jgi:hypothetical protein
MMEEEERKAVNDAENRKEWRAVAVQVTDGEFDSKPKGRMNRKPPEGSLRDALIIGLRGQSTVPEVKAALEYLNHETK